MQHNENGRSMIEMLGVLAIVGVLSVGGIAGYSKAMQKYKVNQLIAQLSETVIGIRSLYASSTSYSGINLPLLFKTGAISHTLQKSTASTSAAVHAMNGDLFIFPSPTNALANGAFELYVTNIPPTACLALATMDWGQDIASGFIGFYIGAGYVDTPQMTSIFSKEDSHPESGIYTAGFHENSIPLPISTATQACLCDGQNCTIGFKYQ